MPYQAPLPIRLEAAATKIETTYGTDPVPTAVANAVRLADRVWTTITPDAEFPNLRDDTVNNSYIPLAAAAAAGQKAEINIVWEFKGLGSAYNPAVVDADPLWQACGWAVALGAGTATYAPVTTQARPSCTIYGWGGGDRQYKVVGCRGNFEARILAGRISLVTFRLQGIIAAVLTGQSVPAATYTAVVPPPAVSQACSIGPWTPDYDEITISSGNDVQWLYTGNNTLAVANGLQSYDFGISRPTVRVVSRAVAGATYDPWTDWTASPPVSRALSLVVGSVANNKGTFSDTALWLPKRPETQNQKNFAGWDVLYRCTAPQVLFN